MSVGLTYHGTNPANVSGIMNTGFNPGRLISVAPGQIFSTNNPAMASRYGTPLKMVTPRSAFSLPSGLLGTGIRGSEVIQSPSAATRGLNLASKLGTEYTGSTAQRLLAGQMVSGLGGISNPALISRILSSPLGRIAGTVLGLPGLAATGLYGLSQQMKPGSALGKFIDEGPTNYESRQNELKEKQRQRQMKKQKDDLAERLAKLNVDNFKKMTNYVTGQQLHGGPSGKDPTTGGASKQKQRENRALGKKRGFNFGGR